MSAPILKRWRASLVYLWYVIRHKYFVGVAGLRLGVPLWRLIAHDLSKFSIAEFIPYRDNFFLYRSQEIPRVKRDFAKAWRHHWQNNDHHWEHHLPEWDVTSIPAMNDEQVLEMAADWMGASRTQTGSYDCVPWYVKQRDRIQLHPETRQKAEALIGYSGV